MGGGERLALRSAMKLCTLTSLTLPYISIEEVAMVGDSCRALVISSIRTSPADLSEDWESSVDAARKFHRLEYFAGDFNWSTGGQTSLGLR